VRYTVVQCNNLIKTTTSRVNCGVALDGVEPLTRLRYVKSTDGERRGQGHQCKQTRLYVNFEESSVILMCDY